ncbi:DUF4198 domain-containing protein [Candidatus Nitrotoga arctica]|uniref:Cobalt ABC transporter substrate-binding protein n=1 Tax=Candidatus Nitrotoga arctica TaxID=453162 RepID=A0ABN8AMG1_9PROT|nr:DUF4198 domain-containing protein [Candidatus Nitrotoga arctica]CAG9933953.1 Cobalt ABC transporter substrate-binding protein [Candidatus Nitrotoga arctica]
MTSLITLLKKYTMTPYLTAARYGVALVVAWLALAPAHAHQVWIEQSAQGATLYFGEYGHNLREVSPGLLDKFVKPAAHKIGGQALQTLEIRKTGAGFALSARADAGESLIAEERNYPISERKEGDKTVRSLYLPAARLAAGHARQPPRLTLDLVPTGVHSADEVQVQAVFKGYALPKVKVVVITPLGWIKEHRTDDEGKFSVKLPWRGTYVLELAHVDSTPGERTSAAGAEIYDRASYVTSLTLESTEGLPSLPAAPAATPNKLN